MVANLFPLKIRPQDVDGAAPIDACIRHFPKLGVCSFLEELHPDTGGSRRLALSGDASSNGSPLNRRAPKGLSPTGESSLHSQTRPY